MRTLIFLALPILLLGLAALVAWARGQPFRRTALNIWSALLLVGYFLGTAGLGIFWVASQELPVFDLHYLFGYLTLLLVICHLAFNSRVVLAFLKRPSNRSARPHSERPARAASLGWARKALPAVAVGIAAFYLGQRWGSDRIVLDRGTGSAVMTVIDGTEAQPTAVGDTAAVLLYHERSSHSLVKALARSPNVYWGRLPDPYKRYPRAPQVALPVPAPARRAGVSGALLPAGLSQSETTALTVQELSLLLFHANGVTASRWGKELRAAASAGALYPTEIYALIRDVAGLAPGIYHYSVQPHALRRLHQGDPGIELSRLLDRPQAASAPATFALTAVLSRTASKYGDRSFRYAAADTGHVARNLHAAARALGLEAELIGRFDDQRLHRLLGVDGVEEIGLLLLAVGLPIRGLPRAGDGSERWELFTAAAAPVDRTGSVGLVHTVTSLRRTAQQVIGRAAPTAAPARSKPAPGSITLPEAEGREEDVFRIIRERRSRRSFARRPISLRDLSGILAFAVRPVREGPLSVEGSASLDCWIVVHEAGALAPGVYRYHPAAHALEPVRQANVRRQSYLALVAQEVAGNAAILLALAADKERLFAVDGARGYRYALLDAGLAGEGVYLEAGARGLGACAVGAFYEPEVNELLSADPSRFLVLHTVALGAL